MPRELHGVLGLTSKLFPCDEDGDFDEESYRNHITWMIENGVHSVGTMVGHMFDYSDGERKRAAEIFVDEVDGRVPSVVGIASWDARTAIKRANDIAHLDVDALFTTGPPLDRPLGDDPERIVDYFSEISDAVDLPIIFYNTPVAWPGVMDAELIKQIERAAPQVEYTIESSEFTYETQRVVEGLAESSIKIVPGKSYNTFYQVKETLDMDNSPVGLSGYLAGLLPAEYVSMWEAFEDDDVDRARDIWRTYMQPIVELQYGRGFTKSANPPPESVTDALDRKQRHIIYQMGVIENERLPYTTETVDDHYEREIAKHLNDVEPASMSTPV